jgi:hypothetical protein
MPIVTGNNQEVVTPTTEGVSLQTSSFLKIPYIPEANTTLNEKYGFIPGVSPPIGTYPGLLYWCAGNGGHSSTKGVGGVSINTKIPHKPTDAALYNGIPFVVRPITNDLPPGSGTADSVGRDDYGGRVLTDINGATYIVYWLKKMDMSAAVVERYIETTNTDATGAVLSPTSVPYVPTVSNLSPAQPVLSTTNVNKLLAQTAIVVAKPIYAMSPAAIAELLNACEVMYGSTANAIHSEVGLCTAIKKAITLEDGTVYDEAACTQIAFHVKMAPYFFEATSRIWSNNVSLGDGTPMINVV